MQKMETRNKLNIEGIRGAIKEKQDKIQMNTKINVGTKCYVSQMRNNHNKYILNSKGITLIALMITIIVLLILAGVTLSLTLRRKRNI